MGLTRRMFVAGLGSVGLGVGVGGVSHLLPLASPSVGEDWNPADESFVPSTCLLCPSHCGIVGRVMDGKLIRIDGNPLHPVSRGGLCAKGAAGLQLLYHPGRVRGPLLREGAAATGRFSSISWDGAIGRIVETLAGLRDRGRAEGMAWVVGDVHGSMGELIECFVGAFGASTLIRESYDDGADEVMALSQGVRAFPAFDLDRADLVLSFGAALSEAWSCLPQAARARNVPPEQRSRWVQVDTRLSRTAVAADDWLAVRPDSYGALAMSIAYVLLKEGLYDSNWIREGVAGFEDWTDESGRRVSGYRSLVLRHASPEKIAGVIGVDVGTIVELAKAFGRSERPLAVWDQNVSWRRGGLSDALAIHALNVLTGALERPGGVYLPSSLPVRPLLSSRTAPAAPETAVARDADWVDRLLGADDPQIDVLFLYRSNPIASSADPDKVRRLFERIPLIVSFSPFLDESATAAHLVLPDHTYLERWQDAPAPPSVPYSAWGLVQPMVEPLHDTRSTGDVVLQLASRLGPATSDALPWQTMEHLLLGRAAELAKLERGGVFASEFRTNELREMAARGWWIDHGQDGARFWKSICRTGGWFDPYYDDRSRVAASRRPDGRVALFPTEARHRLSTALPELVGGFLPLPSERGAAAAAARSAAQDGTLRLMPYRLLTLASGTTPLMPWLLEAQWPLVGGAWEAWVEIHPETARELGLQSARNVRVRSTHGSFTARLCLFEGAQPGTVNAPYGLHTRVEGWGELRPVNPLSAVGALRDPVTGLPDWHGTRVRVEPVSA